MSARRRLRVGITIGIALLLVAITAGYGLWVGPSSTRGILGGYLGAVTAVMGLAFIVLVALLPAGVAAHPRAAGPAGTGALPGLRRHGRDRLDDLRLLRLGAHASGNAGHARAMKG